jgi:class 3 adenylate cyclase
MLQLPSLAQLEVAHVLFMDLVGYSRLPMAQQPGALKELEGIARDTPAFRRAEASADLLCLPTGDGMALVFFRNPVAAVECAMEIGQALRSCPHLPLRMGLHSGPVYRVEDINANRNVSGGGINIAQRVMDFRRDGARRAGPNNGHTPAHRRSAQVPGASGAV